MAKRVTKADVARLERALALDEAEARRLREVAKQAARDADNAEQQIFETRKALIQAINEVNKRK